MRADQIHDGPLDGTELARVIAETVPGVNRDLRHAEWRADLKRRVRDRRAEDRGQTHTQNKENEHG